MKKERFEDHLQSVEEAVHKLESGDLPLEDALAQYEAGVKALKRCEEILAAAEKKVEILLKGESGEPELKPFASRKTEEVEKEQRRAKRTKSTEGEAEELFGNA